MKKKQSFPMFLLLIIGVFLVFVSSCVKDEDNDPVLNKPTDGKSTGKLNLSPTYGTMTDQDGNEYTTVTIGTQTWMAENLRTTKYNDGTAIPELTVDSEWDSFLVGVYCSYNNTTNIDTINAYGRLYNWHAVNTGKLAPKGWHVATDAEWEKLINFIGGESVAGGKLKDTGTIYWISPNEGATNETGFAARPGGNSYQDGTTDFIGGYGYWWSSTEINMPNALCRYMTYDGSHIGRTFSEKELGFSVRCVKD